MQRCEAPFLTRVLNEIALGVALLALVVMTGMPQGWMPAAADDGGVRLVICSAAGNHDVPVPGMPDAPADSSGGMAPCAFAGLGSPALEPPTAFLLALPTAVAFAWAGIAAPARAVALRPWLSPPSRAPPAPIQA